MWSPLLPAAITGVRITGVRITDVRITGVRRYQMSFMKHVRLPEGQALTLHLCDLRSKTCNAPVRSGAKGTQHRWAMCTPQRGSRRAAPRFQIAI